MKKKRIIIITCIITTFLVSGNAFAQVDTVKFKERFQHLRDSASAIDSYPALLRIEELLTHDLKNQFPDFYQKYHDLYHELTANFRIDHSYMRYMTDDRSVYGEMQKSWRANQNISYGTPGAFINSIGARRVDPRPGEGSRNVNLLEANLDNRFTISMGRPHAPTVRRRSRFTFDYRINFRMTLDESDPILPYTNDVGLSLESAVFDSYHKWIFTDKSRYDQTSYSNLKSKLSNHYFITVLLQAHHYSNGQDGSALYTGPEGTRNNYRDGNFSTNYLRFRVAYSNVNLGNNSLLTAALGFRRDGSVGGFLNYDDQQKLAYGYHRIEYFFDWYSRIHQTRDILKNRLDKWQHHIRIDGDYIIDSDLSNFSPNLASSTSNRFRLGINGLLEIRPLSHRTIGYLAKFYFGRDYMNIRYDDIIYSIQVGLSFSLDKYFPSGWYAEPEDLKTKRLPSRK